MANKLQNTFSWSFSRHRMFQECRRMYYINYYAAWGGWEADAPDPARLAYRLKQIVPTYVWAGDLVHRMAERILRDLRNRELNSLERYQHQVRDLLNREWTQSLEKKWEYNAKHNLNLFEHYYGIEVPPADRLALRDKIFRCLEHFMASVLFDRLASLKPAAWKSVEKLEQFVVGEWPVFVKIDCATLSDDRLTIYDWKSGRESEETSVQLGCYALYAYQVWRVPFDRQSLVSFYLDDDVVRETAPTAESLIETRDFILKSMEEMLSALDKPVSRNHASAESFPMTDCRATCRRCSYREICFHTRQWRPEFEQA